MVLLDYTFIRSFRIAVMQFFHQIAFHVGYKNQTPTQKLLRLVFKVNRFRHVWTNLHTAQSKFSVLLF